MPNVALEILAGNKVSVGQASLGGAPGSVGVGVAVGPPGKINNLRFGDLMKPSLPGRAPGTKVTATVVTGGGFDGYDGLGLTYSYNGNLPNAVDFNGNPSNYSIYGMGVSNSGATGPSYRPLDIEFMLTGNYVGIMHCALADFGNLGAGLWVDDEEIDINPLAMPGVNYHSLNLKFSAYGTYRVRATGGSLITSIFTNKNMTVWKPGRRYTLGVVSDSLFEGIGGLWADSAALQLRSATGWKVINLSQGGTGYLNPGGGAYTKFGSPERLAALAATDCDAILVNGTANDWPYTSPALQAAMIEYFQDVALTKPGIPVIVSGIEAQAYFDPLTPVGHRAAQIAACAASPNVVGYIDTLGEDWLTGTGNEIVPTNDGNQDYLLQSDSVHLSARGAKYYAMRLAENMRGMRAGL